MEILSSLGPVSLRGSPRTAMQSWSGSKHRPWAQRLERRILSYFLAEESELKGLKELPKAPVKGEVMKLEVKSEAMGVSRFSGV